MPSSRFSWASIMTFTDKDSIISILELKRHPEGGYYRQTYASERMMHDTPRMRSLASAIVYVLVEGEVSRLHRIDADEMWHHYDGDELVIVEVGDNGKVTSTFLGKDIRRGEQVQHVVKAGVWFGAYVPDGSRGALVGCTVHPAFLTESFEIADREHILSLIDPLYVPIVNKLL